MPLVKLTLLVVTGLLLASISNAASSAPDPLLPHFQKLAEAYQNQNLTAIAEMFNHTSAPSVYVSHWGCEWISLAKTLDTLAEKDFSQFHTGLMILSLPMSGVLKDNVTMSGSVKVRYLAHHKTPNGKDVGLLATGYWFAKFDIPSQKFISFQSLAGLEDAPKQKNATDMIAVSHRFIYDWKYDNMTDFGRLLAPGFVASEQSGSPMNRSMFLKMHNFLWHLVEDYDCQYPASMAHCDYVIDELAQTTKVKVPNNLTTMMAEGSDAAAKSKLSQLLSPASNRRIERGENATLVWTSEYQTHLYHMVKPDLYQPGLPFQILHLTEYEDNVATTRKV